MTKRSAASGGVAPYTYQWSNNATTQNLTNVPAGSYDVTVTGANGCTDVANIDLTNNNPPITATANIAPNTTCNGNYNGSIDVSRATTSSAIDSCSSRRVDSAHPWPPWA